MQDRVASFILLKSSCKVIFSRVERFVNDEGDHALEIVLNHKL